MVEGDLACVKENGKRLKTLEMNISLVGRDHDNGQWRLCVFDRNHEMGDGNFQLVKEVKD